MVVLVSLLCFMVFSPASVTYDPNTIAIILTALQIPCGLYLVCVQVMVIDLFQQRFDYHTALTKFSASGAFAVYLIHYIVINFFSYTWVVILRNCIGIKVEFSNSTT